MDRLNTNTVLGLDISDRSIEVLGLKKRVFGRPRVIFYNRAVLSQGIVEGGEILDADILVRCLGDMLRTAWPRPVRNKLCLISLPGTQVYTHLFRLPGNIKEKQLKAVIMNEASKLNMVDLNNLYFDWRISFRQDETLVFFVAGRKDLINEYIKVLHQVGLIPLAIDLEIASAARALVYLDEPGTNLIVDIGARTTNAGLINNGQVFGMLTIPIGGNALTAALASTARLTLEQAEALKREVGFDVVDTELFNVLQEEMKPVVTGIQDFIDYNKSRGFGFIKKIILTGGSALIPNLLDFLGVCFDEPVVIRDPLRKVYLKEYRQAKNFIFYSNVVGLALRGISPNPHQSGLNLLSMGDYSG